MSLELKNITRPVWLHHGTLLLHGNTHFCVIFYNACLYFWYKVIHNTSLLTKKHGSNVYLDEKWLELYLKQPLFLDESLELQHTCTPAVNWLPVDHMTIFVHFYWLVLESRLWMEKNGLAEKAKPKLLMFMVSSRDSCCVAMSERMNE